jgi:anti-anti-sigma factor
MDIKLHSQLSIQVVSELKDELTKAIDAGGDIKLDASSVETIDAAGLQILVSFVQHAALKKCDLEWCNVSDAFMDAVQLMGLKDALHV